MKRQPVHVEDLRSFAGKTGEPPPLHLPPTLEELERSEQVPPRRGSYAESSSCLPSAGMVGLWPVAVGFSPTWNPQCYDDSATVYQMYMAVPFPPQALPEHKNFQELPEAEKTEPWRDLVSARDRGSRRPSFSVSSELTASPPGTRLLQSPGLAVPYHIPSTPPPQPAVEVQDEEKERKDTQDTQDRHDRHDRHDRQDNSQHTKEKRGRMEAQHADIKNSETAGYSPACSPGEPFWTWSQIMKWASAPQKTRSNRTLSPCTQKLHISAARGDVEACKLYLDCGGDLSAKDANGASALHFAAAGGHLAACRLLLDRGAAESDRDDAGETALQRAARFAHFEVCMLLRDRAQLTDRALATLNSKMRRAAGNGFFPECRLLLESGAEADAEDFKGITALHRAVHGGHLDVCILLLDNGADVDAVDRIHGASALHRAAKSGRADLCALLRDRGADFELEDRTGASALYYATSGGHMQACALLASGATATFL
jgi:ankyrin repeat protein